MNLLSFFIATSLTAIIVMAYCATRHVEDFITGAWVADDGFLQASGAEDIVFYIGKSGTTGLSTCRRVVASVDDKMSIFSIGYSKCITFGKAATIQAHISDESYDSLLPGVIKIDVEIGSGTITIYDDEHAYFVLRKRYDLTDDSY